MVFRRFTENRSVLPMTFKRKAFGQEGEQLALEFLQAHGYKILIQNFKNNLGEVDIIAQEGSVICFVEVKSRTSDFFGDPVSAISKAKRQKLSQVALSYLKANRLIESKARFDVVSIMKENDKPKVELLKDAFELSFPYMY